MASLPISALGRWAGLLALVTSSAVAGDGARRTGPEAEGRFPPLVVPPGFRATLFACDPLVEYPSAVAAGPRAGSILVAVDYLTGLGTGTERRDEIRLIEDTDGDGYAEKATVFATGFNSIQGLAHHGDTTFVMHAPSLTALRDRDGDGVADERRDLLGGLGLSPERDPLRLHCANGVVPGHDDWLYLALGDHGCDVPRPEGDRLVLHGGGILRCRPDGRDLHAFATGLRNIYDVALDEDLNVFVRDNENDGGDYMVRLCRSFHGADHGYPYLYREWPAEALPPLADLGRGSSAGGLCYLEAAFPPEYRGGLFFCEWGRAVVWSRPGRGGRASAPLREAEFAAGAPGDPYGFKPTDLVVLRDGSLIVADWADGQRPKRGRGRVYRIAADAAPGLPPGPDLRASSPLDSCIARLDSERHSERQAAQIAIEQLGPAGTTVLREAELHKRLLGVRGRLHAIWALAHVEGPAAIPGLLDLMRADPEPRVQAQAIRAVADLADPMLTRHRLDAGAGDAKLAARLAESAQGQDPLVLLEAVIALGRWRWSGTPAWLRANLTGPDATLAHAAQQALRRSGHWDDILGLLDGPEPGPMRGLALRALAGQFEPAVVDGLIARLRVEPDPGRRRDDADLLARVAHRPGPWAYWGYRPPERPAHTVAWERTDAIGQALDRLLADPEGTVRLAVLRRMRREKIATHLETLGPWLRAEREPAAVAAILAALREHPAGRVRALLEPLIGDRAQAVTNRRTALDLWAAGLDEADAGRLLDLAGSLEEGPLLAAALRQLGRRPRLAAASALISRLQAPDAEVRVAAVEALAARRDAGAGEPILGLLRDSDAAVRRAAATALGQLQVRSAVDPLLALAAGSEPTLRGASLEALRQLREPRVAPLAAAALTDRALQPIALRCLEELGGPDHLEEVVAVAGRDPSSEILHHVVRLLTTWGQRAGLPPNRRLELDGAVARVQGTSGVLGRWQVVGPLAPDAIPPLLGRVAAPGDALEPPGVSPSGWQVRFATGTEARLSLPPPPAGLAGASWLACTDLVASEEAAVQFLAAGNAPLRVWWNGRLAWHRDDTRSFEADSDRFDVTLARGPNRVVVAVAAAAGGAEFRLRFRRRGSTAGRERLMQLTLSRSGDPGRGRATFFNIEKSQCLKCHRVGDVGGRIGPDLTAIGGRFSRAWIVESILEPGRAIAPGFEAVAVALRDGRVLVGVRTAETEAALTLADQDAREHVLVKPDIEEQRPQGSSLMPDGLEGRFSADEFVDLVAFLGGLK